MYKQAFYAKLINEMKINFYIHVKQSNHKYIYCHYTYLKDYWFTCTLTGTLDHNWYPVYLLVSEAWNLTLFLHGLDGYLHLLFISVVLGSTPTWGMWKVSDHAVIFSNTPVSSTCNDHIRSKNMPWRVLKQVCVIQSKLNEVYTFIN